MKKFLFTALPILLLWSCTNNTEINKENPTVEDDKENLNTSKEDLNKTDSFSADTLFVPKKFPKSISELDAQLLNELDLCTGQLINDSVDVFNPPCDGRLFRIFQMNDNIPANELIAIEILKDLYGNRDNKVVILAKVGEKFITLSTLVGYVLELRTTESGFKDLLVLHPDRAEDMTFGMRYSWNTEKRKYEASELEMVDYGSIKPELKDSLTSEAVKLLTSKNIIIED